MAGIDGRPVCEPPQPEAGAVIPWDGAVMNGFAKIPANIVDTAAWSRGPLHRALLATLYLRANWKTGFFLGREIRPGQVATSGAALADDLHVSRTTLRRALADLRADGVLTIENAANQFSLISLVHWHGCEDAQEHSGRRTARERSADGHNLRSSDPKISSSDEEEGALPAVDASPERPVRKTRGKDAHEPLCPYQDIVALYHDALPDSPRVKVHNADRRKRVRVRWRDAGRRLRDTGKPDGGDARRDWFARFFRSAAASPFLTGREHSPGRRPFVADLDFLFSPKGFAGVIEGKYDARGAA